MNYYVAFAFDKDRAIFFNRFRNSLRENGKDLILLSNRKSIVNDYNNALLISNEFNEDVDISKKLNNIIENSIEYKITKNYKKCSLLARCTLYALNNLSKEINIIGVFIWNGTKIVDRVLSEFAINRKIKKFFFENANIPSRIFFDRIGVNAESSLFVKSRSLNDFSPIVSFEEYQNWKSKYIAKNLESHTVPQAKSVKRINIDFFYDWFYQKIHRIPAVDLFKLRDKLLNKLLANFYSVSYKKHILIPESNYIFFPFQVSTDTQLVLNSSIGNIEALEWIKINYPDTPIVVKLHPAEPDIINCLKYMNYIKRNKNIFLTSDNIFKVMKNSDLVVTINSTAGLQAKMLEKKTIFLGKSLFSRLNSDNDIYHYIFAYLQSIEVFSNNDVDSKFLLDNDI